MKSLFQFWLAHRHELVALIEQHVMLVAVSTAAATAVGVPAGIVAAKRARLGQVLLVVASAAQTIPSLALLGFLLPIPFLGGLGPRTALVTLFVYALLPVVRNTVTGLRGVEPAVVDAGLAMGMSRWQLLRLVEIPLALPSIVAGVRVATVINVGTATIAAAIGAGGLGEYIFRGLAMVDTTTILAGAVPAAALALLADGLLAVWERHAARGSAVAAPGFAAIVLAALLASITLASPFTSTGGVVVGSKNFTEQVILGEVVAQALEAEGVAVVRKLNLGGTFVCDRALRSGDLDVYVEYTGTAVNAIFRQEVPHDSAEALARARGLYAAAGVSLVQPLGFNNTFAVLVREDDAATYRLRSIEDLRKVAREWQPGFGYEFLQRQDGYAGLTAAYGLSFGKQPRGMDLSLIYRALATRQVDVIAGDATSALIDELHLTPLDDSRHYFPPYDAVPAVRTATLLRTPAVGRALARLAGRISTEDMRAMNAAVDVAHRDPRTVAAELLASLPRQPR